MAKPARSPVTGRFMKKEQLDLAREASKVVDKQLETEKQLGIVISAAFRLQKDRLVNEEGIKDSLTGQRDLTKEQVDEMDKLAKKSQKTADAIEDLAPGMVSFAKGAQATAMSMQALLGPIGLAIGIFIAIYKVVTGIAQKLAETRKDLGVSAIEAAKLQSRFWALGIAGKAFGLEAEDIKESFDAIRSTFGGIDEATNKFVFNLAKAKLFTGATAEDLARVISLQESISDASRETLLSQAKVTGELIRQAGVAPGAIFKDIAGNAEFFAQYAKDGGDNIVRAAIEARKLGLSMSQVASISDSLLDFETSIEKQMEASMLLGRQINLDRARQLALTGDQEGMLQEVLKQVGGEAEFNRMNVIQRKALAESVGVNVEELSRLVRNQATGAGATGQLTNNQATQQELMQRIANSTESTSEHTEATATSTRGFLAKWIE
jgi:hypothetical protein